MITFKDSCACRTKKECHYKIQADIPEKQGWVNENNILELPKPKK